MALIQEENILTDTEHRVHIMRIYYGSNVILMSYITKQFVNENG